MMGFSEVRGLRDIWSDTTRPDGRGSARPVPLHPLLDSLGLGLEQVLAYLGTACPDWETFVAWCEATAGPLPGPAVERYHAWYAGEQPPAAERARQAEIMAADPVFSKAEMIAWERDGMIVLHRAITPSEAAAVASHLWAVLDADPDDPTTWYRRREHGIMVQRFQHPAMDIARRAPRVHRAFAQLHGHADLLVSTDRLSFNPPVTDDYAFPGPHLHWDTSLAPPIPLETGGILYLTDTTVSQGALQVVPGFHRRLAEGWLATLGGRDPRGIDLSRDAVAIAASAGDLVIWRQDLPHGASANRSASPRLAQYITMNPMRWPDARPWI